MNIMRINNLYRSKALCSRLVIGEGSPKEILFRLRPAKLITGLSPKAIELLQQRSQQNNKNRIVIETGANKVIIWSPPGGLHCTMSDRITTPLKRDKQLSRFDLETLQNRRTGFIDVNNPTLFRRRSFIKKMLLDLGFERPRAFFNSTVFSSEELIELRNNYPFSGLQNQRSIAA